MGKEKPPTWLTLSNICMCACVYVCVRVFPRHRNGSFTRNSRAERTSDCSNSRSRFRSQQA
jgi:hypothetical protein